MGRTKLPAQARKSANLTIYLTKVHLLRLRKEANLQGRYVSELIREILITREKEALR